MSYTIKDVARDAGVSITTVSKILNHNDKDISDQTILRVKEIIRKNNYIPSGNARSLVTKKTKMIGLIIPDISNNYFAKLAHAVELEARKEDYAIILCNTDDVYETEISYLKLLLEKSVDGIIIVPTVDSTGNELDSITLKKKPIVILDRVHHLKEDKPNEGAVFFDNILGGYLATKSLIDAGHTRIGCLTGPMENKSAQDRLKGFKQALESNNLKFDKDLIIEGNYRYSSGYKAAELFFKNKVSGIFSQNDLMATGLYSAAIEKNVLIGKDISIVGYDDSLYCDILAPKLTSISQLSAEMGTAAAVMLGDMMNGRPCSRLIEFEPTIHIRNSIAKI